MRIFAVSLSLHINISCLLGAAQTRRTENQNRTRREKIAKENKREQQLIVRVTPEERAYIQKKMAQFGTENFSAYARKMLIDGYVVHVDLSDFQMLAGEVNKVGVNINQIAKGVNESGLIYGDEMQRLQEMMEEIWRLLKSFLSELLSKSR